jgi:integrative and conjugative element protein (TIGR02256 family)
MEFRFSESESFDAILVFPEITVYKFYEFRKSRGKRESGGMLFCKKLNETVTTIEGITGPSYLDICRQFMYLPNKRCAQKKIDKMFKAGFHYVGDWHSHPQEIPVPSSRDLFTMKSIFTESSHGLNYMIHVILPSRSNFENAYVAVTDGVTVSQCSYVGSL